MSFESAVRGPGARCLYAQITRANGKVERRRLVAYSHPNPFKEFIVNALITLGVF